MEIFAGDTGVFPVPKKEDAPLSGPSESGSVLMERVREGDRDAFEGLYHKYARTVAAFLRRDRYECSAVDDLTQEVFSRLWEYRNRIRSDAPIQAYLLGFARNILRERRACTNRQDSARRRFKQAEPKVQQAGPEARAHQKELAESVRSHIGGLPCRQRQAIELVYLANQTIAEAARLMHCSVETLRRCIRRALDTLEVVCRVPRPDADVKNLKKTGY
jgi:RNA polymerase sigma-70 factor (ECF subfamily)